VSRYYAIDGTPITFEQWAAADANPERQVGDDTIDGVVVSTVLLGINHRFGNGPPLIFETMIFGGEHNEEQWRYSTLAEAKAGHAAAVELVRSGAT